MAVVHVMALVADEVGVLRRICGVYESRRYRVRSLTAGPSGHPGVLRVNLAVDEPPERARRLAAQLARLIDVISVDVAEAGRAVGRELALVKVVLPAPDRRPEVLQVAQVFRARVVDVAPRSLVMELTGDTGKVDAFIRLVEEFGAVEVVRTGAAAVRRGERVLAGAALDRGREAGEDGAPATVAAGAGTPGIGTGGAFEAWAAGAGAGTVAGSHGAPAEAVRATG